MPESTDAGDAAYSIDVADATPQKVSTDHIYVRTGYFSQGNVRYKMDTRNGSPLLKLKGPDAITSNEKSPLARYENMHIDPGDTRGSYLLRMSFIILILTAGLGLCGLIILGFSGLQWGWKKPSVNFTDISYDDDKTDMTIIEFRETESMNEFIETIRSKTSINIRED
ncbi:MAG: hypothetical protein HOL01_12245 [Planctomycetaceae bacterium]|nr:hypothetical protein [Planctomycetaceae bacterium]MBT6495312.1 hypothetical protein [Planctomycetaceae bacterium]